MWSQCTWDMNTWNCAGAPRQPAQGFVSGQPRAGAHVQQHDVVLGRAQLHAGGIAAIGSAGAKRQTVDEVARLVQRVEVQASASHQRRRHFLSQLLQAQRRRQRSARAPEPHRDAVAADHGLEAGSGLRGLRTRLVGERERNRRMAGEQGIETADLEDLGDDGLQSGDRHRNAGGARLFRGDHQHAQTGAGDVVDAAEVQHQLPVAAVRYQRQQGVAEGFGGRDVQPPDDCQDLGRPLS